MLLYNGILLPKLPSWDSTTYKVSVISRVESGASAQFAGAQYILVLGASIMWQNSKCYVSNITGVYRFNGSAWVWHYGSGTTYTQDIVASGFFEAVWTNTTIPTADGSGVYLAASLPVDPNAPEEPGEPEEPEEPVAPVDAAKIFRRGWMSGFITGLNVRAALAHKVIEEPDEPITADFYLYGTPNASGNVALADGDGYVLYKAGALPKLPEWDKSKYPYAVVQYIDSALSPGYHIARVICASEPIIWQSTVLFGGGGLGLLGDVLYFGLVEDARLWEWLFPNVDPTTPVNTWAKSGENHYDELTDFNPSASPSGFKWANHDVINISKDTVFISASAPIPLVSNEPVAAVYGDRKLPVLPSDIDSSRNLFICKVWDETSTYMLFETKVPPYWNGEFYDLPESSYRVYEIVDGAWKYVRSSISDAWTWKLMYWSNFDILDGNGEVYFAKSDPIPAYEQKE